MVGSTLLFIVAGLVIGQVTASAEDLKPRAAKLVRQLDAQEKARRDDAEQELLKLGTAVLPLLPESEVAPAEVKLRLGRVRAQLEKLRGDKEVRAREVTVSGAAMPLGEVLAAIEKQTGDKLVDYRQEFNQQVDVKTLKLNLEKVPFWPALDQVLDEAGMTIYSYAGDPGLALVNRASTEVPRYNRGVYSGAFRVEANDVVARRDLRDPNGQSLRVQVEVAWEPRLKPIAIWQAGDSMTATTDSGEALALGPNGELETTVNPGESSVQMPLVFALPPRQATKITSLKGAFSVLLPGPIETFRFEKLQVGAKGEQRRAGVKVILEQVRQNNLVWEVRMRAVFDKPGQALESHRTWVLHNDAFLETADKEKINYAGLETTRQGENEVGVAYMFDVADVVGHTFVYQTPAVLLDAAVPYELRDIPLP
jgi:hypothetical protein